MKEPIKSAWQVPKVGLHNAAATAYLQVLLVLVVVSGAWPPMAQITVVT